MLAKAESELSNRLFFWCYGCCIQRCPPQVLTVVGDDGVLLRLQPYWLHQTHHAGHLSSTRMTDLEDFRTCAVVLAAENTKISEGYKTRGMANAFLRVWEEAARDLHAASSIEYDDGGAPLEVWQLWKLREERKLSVTGFIVVPTHTGGGQRTCWRPSLVHCPVVVGSIWDAEPGWLVGDGESPARTTWPGYEPWLIFG
ncbi:uncharacterized protein [Lolium perenne]|uniref:uncharacterized protein isoform X2 n=1 Tax=Lolium perenne TaxID=4522 RepID=UPI0021F5709C|nr:uncharacterized protein LOC127325552 isoform X2 [Lolium perenne]